MSRLLINRSPDLQRLRDEGYDVSTCGAYLLVQVPYVNSRKEVLHGVMVTDLTLAGDVTTTPANHVVWFQGEHPCSKHGVEIEAIRHAVGRQVLAQGVEVDRSFSNKPQAGYKDYFEKVSTYAGIIGHPAESLSPSAKIRTFRAVESDGDEVSVFQYLDSAATRSGIALPTNKFKGQKVAIVGLGGTGGYTLDLVAKCPVDQIDLFDGDVLLQHNAFRAPGAVSLDDLSKRRMKVDWFAESYSRMHRRIVPHDCYIDASNVEQLATMSFVFMCVDRNDSRKSILDFLAAHAVPFVDAGMGIELDETGALAGILRVTSSAQGKQDHLARRVPLVAGNGDGIYASNIQVADLNCFNAAMAVIKWKKLTGFYRDLEREQHSTYTSDSNMMLSEERVCAEPS